MIALTWLYAPADRPDLVAKALAGPADVVIIDLEDAVAKAAKDAARTRLPDLLAAHPGRPVQVRVNAPGTPWAEDDLRAVAALGDAVEVRVPKVQSPDQVERIHATVRRPIHALLETPLAIERAFEIAGSGVASLGLGEADLRSALGVGSSADLGWQRARVVNAAAAAGPERRRVRRDRGRFAGSAHDATPLPHAAAAAARGVAEAPPLGGAGTAAQSAPP